MSGPDLFTPRRVAARRGVLQRLVRRGLFDMSLLPAKWALEGGGLGAARREAQRVVRASRVVVAALRGLEVLP